VRGVTSGVAAGVALRIPTLGDATGGVADCPTLALELYSSSELALKCPPEPDVLIPDVLLETLDAAANAGPESKSRPEDVRRGLDLSRRRPTAPRITPASSPPSLSTPSSFDKARWMWLAGDSLNPRLEWLLALLPPLVFVGEAKGDMLESNRCNPLSIDWRWWAPWPALTARKEGRDMEEVKASSL
jgi:hypothetical protein